MSEVTFSDIDIEGLNRIMTDLQEAEELSALSFEDKKAESTRLNVLNSLHLVFGHRLQKVQDDGTFPSVVMDAKAKLEEYLLSSGALDPDLPDANQAELDELFNGPDSSLQDDGDGRTRPPWSNN